MLDKRAVVQFANGLPQFGLGVHHDRTVPSYGLFERLTRDQEEANALGASLHDDFVAAVEQDEGMVLRVINRGRVRVNRRLGEDGLRIARVAERSAAGKHVSERMAS